MGKWDCPICGKRYSEMLTPTEWNRQTFCGEDCKNVAKARPHRIKASNRPEPKHDRSPSLGVWRNLQDSVLWEDSWKAR